MNINKCGLTGKVKENNNILVSSSTTFQQLHSITKMPNYGSYEYRVEGSGCGLNRNRYLVGL